MELETDDYYGIPLFLQVLKWVKTQERVRWLRIRFSSCYV